MDQESYTLHPVFAQFICEKCKPEIENHMGMIVEFQKDLEKSANNSGEQFYWHLLFAQSFIGKMNSKESELLVTLEKTCCDLAKDMEAKIKEENRQNKELIRKQEEEIEQREETYKQLEEERKQLEKELRQTKEEHRWWKEESRRKKEELRKQEEMLRQKVKESKRLDEEHRLLKRAAALLEKVKKERTLSIIIIELLKMLDGYEAKDLDIVFTYFLVAWLEEEIGEYGIFEKHFECGIKVLGESIWLL